MVGIRASARGPRCVALTRRIEQIRLHSSGPAVRWNRWWAPCEVRAQTLSVLAGVLRPDLQGAMQLVVRAAAWVMQRTMRTSGAETLCTAMARPSGLTTTLSPGPDISHTRRGNAPVLSNTAT